MYTKLFTSVVQAKAAFYGKKTFSILRNLQRQQYLPTEEITQLQLNKLRRLIDHAIAKSPFYNSRLSHLGSEAGKLSSIEQLASVPLLRREDLQSKGKEIVCVGDKTIYADSSGGSTGNPVNFFHDSQYKEFGEALYLLFLAWLNVDLGDKTAFFWGADRDFRQLNWREKLDRKLSRNVQLNSFSVTDKDLNDFLFRLSNFKPRFVVGYATSLFQAAKRINQLGLKTIRPVAVRSSAEVLYNWQRQEIELAFRAPVYDFYGSREVNNLAAECPAQEGLHIMAPGRIVEIVDERGNQLPNGQVGSIVVTDLTNFSFPFIRYLNGDIGSISTEKCSCGRTFPLLRSLQGRSSDILEFNGQHIHGEYFTHLFYGKAGVKQFQVVQDAKDSLILRVVSSEAEIDLSQIVHSIKSKLGRDIIVRIERVESIPPLPSGKYRFTVNTQSS